jgi:hypothetical protein
MFALEATSRVCQSTCAVEKMTGREVTTRDANEEDHCAGDSDWALAPRAMPVLAQTGIRNPLTDFTTYDPMSHPRSLCLPFFTCWNYLWTGKEPRVGTGKVLQDVFGSLSNQVFTIVSSNADGGQPWHGGNFLHRY